MLYKKKRRKEMNTLEKWKKLSIGKGKLKKNKKSRNKKQYKWSKKKNNKDNK